jgi:hypothetical protein
MATLTDDASTTSTAQTNRLRRFWLGFILLVLLRIAYTPLCARCNERLPRSSRVHSRFRCMATIRGLLNIKLRLAETALGHVEGRVGALYEWGEGLTS